MVDNFTSYPDITLKKLQDGDALSTLKEKIQHNFDQIYLHTVNVMNKGSKGDIGWSGLSIKGDKGDKGDVGSVFHFDNIPTDGGLVLNPNYNLGDIVVNDAGQYFEIIDDNGILKYDLAYTPNVPSDFVDELIFGTQGIISNHKLRHFDTINAESNILLAKRIGGDAEYMRLIIGNNTFVGSDLDTLTLCNILGESNTTPSQIADAFGTDSKPFSQLNLKFRNTPTGSASLTSMDFIYYIKSNVEWSVIKNNQAEFGTKNDINSGVTSKMINTNRLVFSGGVSDIENMGTTNSLIFSKSQSIWLLTFPTTEKLRIGNQNNITIHNDRVGIGTGTGVPTHTLHGMGTFRFVYPNPSFPTNIGDMTMDGTKLLMEHSSHKFEITPTIISMIYDTNRNLSMNSTNVVLSNSANQKIDIGLTSITIIFNNSVGLEITSSESRIKFNSSNYAASKNGEFLMSVFGSAQTIAGETLIPIPSVHLAKLTPDGFQANIYTSISNVLNIIGRKSGFDGGDINVIGGYNVNSGFGVGRGGDINIAGGSSQTSRGGHINLVGGAGSTKGRVKLINNVSTINPTFDASWNIVGNTSGSLVYLTNTSGSVSTSITSLSAKEYDRILYTYTQGVGDTDIQIFLETGIGTNIFRVVGRVVGYGSATVIIPADIRYRITMGHRTTSLSVDCTIQKFGV